MSDVIDKAIERASRAQQLADEAQWQEASELYSRAAQDLRTLLRSNKIKDDRSRAFLGSQCDDFQRQADITGKKAQAKRERDLIARARQLRGLQAKPKSDAELNRETNDLRSRFAKLQGPSKPAASLDELQARLEALGPSQFPDKASGSSQTASEESEDPRVKEALERARAEDRSGYGISGDMPADIDPDLGMLLHELDSNENVTDEALQALLGAVGVSSIATTSAEADIGMPLNSSKTKTSSSSRRVEDDEVEALIRQARDFARFGGGVEESSQTLDQEKDHKSRNKKKHGHDSEDDESYTESSSESDDSDESDDDDAARKGKKSKKKSKSQEKSGRRWGLF
mmetsp:Transcript_14289/g.27750  ORF Transcript_14289/g.27750 Transcript_14289/m.27750 type:complete len:343 (+) Transcript_14289:133-1161(+)